MRYRHLIVLSLVLGLWIPTSSQTPWGTSAANAAIFDSFDASRHNRYLSGTTPNPTFLLDEAELSGVGGRAALISPRHFITAAHIVGGISPYTATFRGSDGILRSYTTATFEDLATTYVNEMGTVITAPSDIRLYTLEPGDIVAPEITPMAIALGSPSDFIGRQLFALGRTNTGVLHAGRNVIDAVGIATFSGGNRPTVNTVFSFDTAANGGTGGLGDDEVGLISGDSGFQSLIEIDGEIALLGAHFGISSSIDAANRLRYDSFSSLLSPYIDQITAIVSADGQSIRTLSVVTIPEPSITWALAAGVAVIVYRRRKASANIRSA
jgi:hypothetical protein